MTDWNLYQTIDYRMLTITVGAILASGMVHTEHAPEYEVDAITDEVIALQMKS